MRVKQNAAAVQDEESAPSEAVSLEQCPQTTGEFLYKNVRWNEYTSLPLLQKIERAFHFLESDVILLTHPRNGTTLTQEIIWQLFNRDKVLLDPACYSKETGVAQFGELYDRFSFLEFVWPPSSAVTSRQDAQISDHIDHLMAMSERDELLQQAEPPLSSRRLIKTHCPLSFFVDNPDMRAAPPPSTAKIVVVLRNPRDACVSLFHFYRGLPMFGPWQGTFEQMVRLFCAPNHTVNGSYFAFYAELWHDCFSSAEGDEHDRRQEEEEVEKNVKVVLPRFTPLIGCSRRHGFPVIWVRYEALIMQPHSTITALAQFLGVETASSDTSTPSSSSVSSNKSTSAAFEEQLDAVIKNVAFDRMRRTSVNFEVPTTGFNFMRKGAIGDWKRYFRKGYEPNAAASEAQSRGEGDKEFDVNLIKLMDDATEKYFGNTGIRFNYD